MNQPSENAVALWTGGKDSCLALYEAECLGYEIKSLITFIPPNPQFLAHPLQVIKFQSEALHLQHATIEITQPFNEGYKSAFRFLKERCDVSHVITGDIDEVSGHPNWVKELAASSDIEVLTPLWKRDRKEILATLIENNFKVIFSCAKEPWFSEDWLGTEFDTNTIERLYKISEETGLDLCGENGEYHSLVLDCPLFKQRIHIDDFSKEAKDVILYINIRKLSLINKASPQQAAGY
ncbi:MAG: diphthine--ammonia ligase [Bacteroidetes bacterium]|nr:diphthine--ammonia ligase [Bacteroidota bacterium]